MRTYHPIRRAPHVTLIERTSPLDHMPPLRHISQIAEGFTVDAFFEPISSWRHALYKISQIIVTLFVWCIVLAPLIICYALIKRPFAHPGETQFLSNFYSIVGVLFLGMLCFGIILCMWNNHTMSHTTKRYNLHHPTYLKIREAAVESVYARRFGPRSKRIQQRYVSVPASANLKGKTLQILEPQQD